jgi:hypothetical protein
MEALNSLGPTTRPVRIQVKGQSEVTSVDISFTEQERRIFHILLETVSSLGLKTQVRVAGGWVRDKLLGRPNDDIDVAVDDMMGAEFAAHVVSHMTALGLQTHSVGVIHANPEQSKHLETATTRVLDSWIDFVNLRTETYDPTSRIPHVGIGTPEQDAERRDFTVNALFYNVTTDTIEDLTGRGIADLRAGVISCPLAPRITFLDDPLRVLRAVRFASRYGFAIERTLREAAMDREVVGALAGKISRERVGIETDNMLSGARPVASLRALEALGILQTVFAMPKAEALAGRLACAEGVLADGDAPPSAASSESGPRGAGASAPVSSLSSSSGAASSSAPAAIAPFLAEGSLASVDPAAAPLADWLAVGMRYVEALDYVSSLVPSTARFESWEASQPSAFPSPLPASAKGPASAAPESLPDYLGGTARLSLSSSSSCDVFPSESRKILAFSSVLFPASFASRIVSVKKGKEESLVHAFILESLKLPAKLAASIAAVQSAAAVFASQVALPSGPDRLVIGQCLRRDVKELWPLALHLSAALHVSTIMFGTAGSGSPSSANASASSAAAVSSVLSAHARLHGRVGEWGLDGCWGWKPLLDGKRVTAITGVKGPNLGLVMEKQAEWRLLHPHATAEDCEAWFQGGGARDVVGGGKGCK